MIEQVQELTAEGGRIDLLMGLAAPAQRWPRVEARRLRYTA